jgi:hypothetical protein
VVAVLNKSITAIPIFMKSTMGNNQPSEQEQHVLAGPVKDISSANQTQTGPSAVSVPARHAPHRGFRYGKSLGGALRFVPQQDDAEVTDTAAESRLEKPAAAMGMLVCCAYIAPDLT